MRIFKKQKIKTKWAHEDVPTEFVNPGVPLLILLIIWISMYYYRLIWVCSSPDFAGRYPFGLKVWRKTDSTPPLQFLAMITPVTLPKRSFGKSFGRPMVAASRFTEKRFRPFTSVISRASQRQSARHFWWSHQQPNEYRTRCALAGVSLYDDAGELVS